MKFTRRELKRIFTEAEIDVPKDVLTSICDLHTSSNDDLIEAHEKELEEAKKAAGNGEDTVKKADYDKVNNELKQLKENIADKEANQAKVNALMEMYKGLGIPEAMVKIAIKATNLKEIELDKDGKIKDEEARKTGHQAVHHADRKPHL